MEVDRLPGHVASRAEPGCDGGHSLRPFEFGLSTAHPARTAASSAAACGDTTLRERVAWRRPVVLPGGSA